MRFTIEFKQGITPIATIEGFKDVDTDTITVKIIREIADLEQKLEFLTGYRVHIKEA